MRRRVCLLLVLSIAAVFLTSCGNISDIQLPALPTDSNNSDESSDESTPDSDTDTIIVDIEADPSEAGSTVIVSGKEFETAFEAPDGSGDTILTFSYYTPVVNINGNPEASNAINDYLNSVDEVYYSGNEKYSGVNYYHELALDNYSYVTETGSDINTDFYSVRKFTCVRCDSSVISFIYTTYDYFGIANESYFSEGLSFNVSDGSKIEFINLASDSDMLLDICAENLSNTDFVNNDSIKKLSENNGWYIDNEGIVFLAPDYSSLSIPESCCVSFNSVSELINPSFLSREIKDGKEANVSLVSSDSYSDNTLNIIDRVQIDETSESSFLYIQGKAYDVSISYVEYNDFDGNFFITDTIWYCNILSYCAVQLEIAPPSGLPVIMISFKDANDTAYQLLVVEGEKDGTVVLTDEDIVPLG